MPQILYIVVGIIGGAFSGALGIGGGAIMVPLLIMFFGLSQHQAQGTSLAVMMLPVFILAVWKYYQQGHIQVPMVILIAIGFVAGAYLGASFVQGIPDENLKKAFGIFLIVMGIKMVFLK